MNDKWLSKLSCIEMIDYLKTTEKSFITQFLYDSIIFHLRDKK